VAIDVAHRSLAPRGPGPPFWGRVAALRQPDVFVLGLLSRAFGAGQRPGLGGQLGACDLALPAACGDLAPLESAAGPLGAADLKTARRPVLPPEAAKIRPARLLVVAR